jgi:ABC-type nitrate/sulfonate/bicarbonate transport system substrate-binding protein
MTLELDLPSRMDPASGRSAGPARPALEKTRLTLGFVPLVDAAPLVVALEHGLFEKHGLDVALSREPSWANIRDKVSAGALDGAHMLAGMPLAASLGVGALKSPMVTGLVLETNGNAITVSNALHARMLEADPSAMAAPATTARALKAVIAADRRAGRAPLTFAMTFPVATHNYELRAWLAGGGVDPDIDLKVIVVPPPQMVAHLSAGTVAGYCVGEPWNGLAVERGIGRILITKPELMSNAPEKVLGVGRDWAERHPATHLALITALLEAAVWLDADPAHRAEAAELLCGGYIDAPIEVVARSLTGWLKRGAAEAAEPHPDFHLFHRYAAGFPWRSYADWTIAEMLRWGQISTPLDIRATSDAIYRPELYRSAAHALGLPFPTIDRKIEGRPDAPWLLTAASRPIAMGRGGWADGGCFDPARPLDYLAGQKIARLQAELAALAALNPPEPTR